MLLKKDKSFRTTNVFLLIDRTGSMLGNWSETISAINSYVKNLEADPEIVADLTVAFFDRDANNPVLQFKEWVSPGFSADDKSIEPRGMTPLYDAVGQMASVIRAKGLTRNDLVQFVIMTDGGENCSREFTLDGVKSLVQGMERDNWHVLFLGADLASFQGGLKFSNFNTSAQFKLANVVDTFGGVVYEKTRAYAKEGNLAAASFTVADRTRMTK